MKKTPEINNTRIKKKKQNKIPVLKHSKINAKNTKQLNKKEVKSKKEVIQKLLFKKDMQAIWTDQKTKETKNVVILEIKKRIKVEFSDGSFRWVGQNNLILPGKQQQIVTTKVTSDKKNTKVTSDKKNTKVTSDKKNTKVTSDKKNTKVTSDKKNISDYEILNENLSKKLFAEISEKLEEALEERDKARAYRIDMENEKNEMRLEINQLKEQIEDKERTIKKHLLEIREYKQRLQEQIRRASKSELENRNLLNEIGSYKEELDHTKEELDYTSQMKNFNQSEKISLQDRIADSAKQKIYISSDSITAKKREEDIAAGLPVSNNIEVIDVYTLQQQLINAAKEKYKDNAYIKVLKDTMKRKEEKK